MMDDIREHLELLVRLNHPEWYELFKKLTTAPHGNDTYYNKRGTFYTLMRKTFGYELIVVNGSKMFVLEKPVDPEWWHENIVEIAQCSDVPALREHVGMSE